VLCRVIHIGPEMEFMDMLHAIHSPFYRWILKKTILFSCFHNPYKKKINKTRKLESIPEYYFVDRKNEGKKQTKL
jgi:hypothetical protein